MNLIFLFIPKPEGREDGKLARLGLVAYWTGTAIALTSFVFGLDGNTEHFLIGAGFFFLGRAVLFILADR